MNKDNIEIYNVETEPDFDKEANRLVKKKKFKSLNNQIEDLVDQCEQGKFDGDKFMHSDYPTSHDVYKLRLPNLDTNDGKSNGYRVIYMVVTDYKIVVFLTMYYKKEKPNVTDSYIKGLIDGYFMNWLPEEPEE